jgi:hypothetical protein
MQCEEYFFLGKENEWWRNRETMYLLKDFLLSHTNHELKIGGDEWNRIYPEPEGHKEKDTTYSKQDYQEEDIEKLSEVKVADGTPTTTDGIPPNNKLLGILPTIL